MPPKRGATHPPYELFMDELRRIYLPRLYEKPSNTGKPPRHEANHGSIYERLAARTQPLVIFAHPPVLLYPTRAGSGGSSRLPAGTTSVRSAGLLRTFRGG